MREAMLIRTRTPYLRHTSCQVMAGHEVLQKTGRHLAGEEEHPVPHPPLSLGDGAPLAHGPDVLHHLGVKAMQDLVFQCYKLRGPGGVIIKALRSRAVDFDRCPLGRSKKCLFGF